MGCDATGRRQGSVSGHGGDFAGQSDHCQGNSSSHLNWQSQGTNGTRVDGSSSPVRRMHRQPESSGCVPQVGPVTSRTLGDHVRRQRRALRSDVCRTGRADGPDARESAGLCLPFGYRLDWLRSGCVLDGWLCQSRPALGVLGPRFAAGLRVSVECGRAVEAQEWRQQSGGSSCAAHSRPGVAGLSGLSAFTVISARALHERRRGNGRHRFEPLSSRRGRALLPGRCPP